MLFMLRFLLRLCSPSSSALRFFLVSLSPVSLSLIVWSSSASSVFTFICMALAAPAAGCFSRKVVLPATAAVVAAALSEPSAPESSIATFLGIEVLAATAAGLVGSRLGFATINETAGLGLRRLGLARAGLQAFTLASGLESSFICRAQVTASMKGSSCLSNQRSGRRMNLNQGISVVAVHTFASFLHFHVS